MGIPVFQHPWHTLCFAAPLSHWTLKQETLNCSVLSPNLPNQNHQSCQIDNLIQRVEQHIHKCHDLNQKDNKCCPIIFQPNDRVDLWKPLDFLHPGRGRKYARHWSGPYVVVEHCWEKPWRVTIRDTAGTWQKPVCINQLRLHGQTHVTNQFTKFWSPFAPPLQPADIKKGHHFQWIEREKVINRGIDE